MELEQIYLAVADRLAEIEDLKWIDMDFGQLDDFNVRPSVAFPCALISIDITNAIELGQKKQKCQIVINVKLGFSYTGETSQRTAAYHRQKALAYYHTVREVYTKLQGQRIESTTPLRRTQQIETARPDRIKITEMPFSTEFLDVSAAE